MCHLEAVAQRYSVKKVFLEIRQNSQENTCTRVSFSIKLQASGLQLYGTGVFLCILSNFSFVHRTSLVAASGHLWI